MKRTRKDVRKDILKDNKIHSYGDLERKANTNWKTIRDHIEDLELFNAVEVSKENKIKITKQGLELLKKL
jgi:predicted transcriptional regulator